MNNKNTIFWIIITSLLLIIKIIKLRKKGKHMQKISAAKNVLNNINNTDKDTKAWLFSYLRQIDPFAFEELILLTFKRRGFRIYRNKRYTHDGGIDGKVKKNGELFLIQAKRYSDYIKPEHLNDFIKVCRKSRCRGYFIHTGKSGKEIYGILKNNPQIKLINGFKLYKFFRLSENVEDLLFI